ncbi:MULTISPECIES: ribosomal protein S18-alanine N-acetyltransferase [Marinobacter]|uniref:[Ribosomal protein bS18]-alanine N-acetyltransferase n=1 Tax=Marinobacter xiaoshiensis TaxID=3073652 RepID=A0ABU2HLM7_9GAMM|nr:ribosomal protein S18-alanine N-acetyltransferase [Marinobacter sp. F60267]MDS1311969.1 ribosomal protein S18-alanine N-acetyltransferase [Marinobacter sp. F60267]
MTPKNSDLYDPMQGLEVKIRPLVPEDMPEMLEIERQGHSHPWTEGVFLDCFKPDYRLWGAWLGGSLEGFVVGTYMLDEVHLLNICVHPRSRSHGVGRLLLRHLIAEATHEGMNQMLLEVRLSNSVASKLYRNEGFEEIGRRPGYYPAASGREDARVMSLLLCP